MTTYYEHPSCLWPSDEQTLLLKAALLHDDNAVTAFQTWRDTVDLDAEFPRPAFRLLPLVYANLQQLGVRDALLERLKGVYRLTWCKNQQLLHAMQPVLAQLRQGGIDVLLLKGLPLSLNYYASPALRPMADIDVAVRPTFVPQALALLRESGWQCQSPTADDLRYRHALLCRRTDGLELDLHYHLLRDCLHEDADTFFWANTEPVNVSGVDALQLNPTALLFHTLLHGIRWNEETPIRWIPDALMIMRQRGANIDWQQLLTFAEQQSMTYRLGLGLTYLAAHFAVVLPEAVTVQLQHYRPSWRERIEKTVVLGDYSRWYAHPLGKQWVIFANYCRYSTAPNPFDFLVGYSHYLRYVLELRGRSEILPAIVGGLWRRLCRVAGNP